MPLSIKEQREIYDHVQAKGGWDITIEDLRKRSSDFPGIPKGTFSRILNILSGQNCTYLYEATKIQEADFLIPSHTGMGLFNTLGSILDAYGMSLGQDLPKLKQEVEEHRAVGKILSLEFNISAKMKTLIEERNVPDKALGDIVKKQVIWSFSRIAEYTTGGEFEDMDEDSALFKDMSFQVWRDDEIIRVDVTLNQINDLFLGLEPDAEKEFDHIPNSVEWELDHYRPS